MALFELVKIRVAFESSTTTRHAQACREFLMDVFEKGSIKNPTERGRHGAHGREF